MTAPIGLYVRPPSYQVGTATSQSANPLFVGTGGVAQEIFGQAISSGAAGELSLGAQPALEMMFFSWAGQVTYYTGTAYPKKPDGSLNTVPARYVLYDDSGALLGLGTNGTGQVTYWDFQTGGLVTWNNRADTTLNKQGNASNNKFNLGAKQFCDGVTFWLPGTTAVFTWRFGAVDNTNNMENATSWQEEFSPAQIASGAHDAFIKAYAAQLGDWIYANQSTPVEIRFAQEMNGNNYGWAFNNQFHQPANPDNGPRLLNALDQSGTVNSGSPLASTTGAAKAAGYTMPTPPAGVTAPADFGPYGLYAAAFRRVAYLLKQQVFATLVNTHSMTNAAAETLIAANLKLIWCVGSGSTFPSVTGAPLCGTAPNAQQAAALPFPQVGTVYGGSTLNMTGATVASSAGTTTVTLSAANALPQTRTDAATVTSGSSTVTDASVLSTDKGSAVSGTGIPAGTFVGTVTAGASFTLVDANNRLVNATANGTSVTIVTPGSVGHAFPIGSKITFAGTGGALDGNTYTVTGLGSTAATDLITLTFSATITGYTASGGTVGLASVTSYVAQTAPWLSYYPGDDSFSLYSGDAGVSFIDLVSMDGYNAQHVGTGWKQILTIFDNTGRTGCYSSLVTATKSGNPSIQVTETACIENPINPGVPLQTLSAGGLPDGAISGGTALTSYLVNTYGTSLVGLQITGAGVPANTWVTAVNTSTNTATLSQACTNGTGLNLSLGAPTFTDGAITAGTVGTVNGVSNTVTASLTSAGQYPITTSETGWIATSPQWTGYAYVSKVTGGTATLVFPMGTTVVAAGGPSAASGITVTLTPPTKADWLKINFTAGSTQSFGNVFPKTTGGVIYFDHNSTKASGFSGTYALRSSTAVLTQWRALASDSWFTNAGAISSYPSPFFGQLTSIIGIAEGLSTTSTVPYANEPFRLTDTGDFGVGDGTHTPNTAALLAIRKSEKGANNGVATLDGSGQVPAGQLGNVTAWGAWTFRDLTGSATANGAGEWALYSPTGTTATYTLHASPAAGQQPNRVTLVNSNSGGRGITILTSDGNTITVDGTAIAGATGYKLTQQGACAELVWDSVDTTWQLTLIRDPIWNVVSKSGAYTLQNRDLLIATASSWTATLPSATTGGRVGIVNKGAGTITLSPAPTVGPSTLTANESVHLVSDGTNWYVLGAFLGTPVTSVAAADTSVVIGGTSTAPTVATGTLDVIATQHPAAANWSNNNHKITSLAQGTASGDGVNVGQLPPSNVPVLVAGHSWEQGGPVFQKDYNRDRNYPQRAEAYFGGIGWEFQKWAVNGAKIGADDSLISFPSSTSYTGVRQGGWATVAQMMSAFAARNQPGFSDATTAPWYSLYEPIARGLQIIGSTIENQVGTSPGAYTTLGQGGDSTTGKGQKTFTNALRFEISLLRAAAIYFDNDASIAYSASARTLATNTNLGSGYSTVTTNGGTITITLPADFQGGTIAIGFRVAPNRTAGTGVTFSGTASRLPGGSSANTGSNNNQWSGTTLLLDTSLVAVNNTAIPVCVRITGLLASDAGKTIIATTASAVAVDVMGWWVEAPTARAPVQIVRNGSLIGPAMSSTLNGAGVLTTSTSATGAQPVTATASFPQTGSFTYIIDTEQVLATVTDAVTINVTARAQNGSAGATHATNAAINGCMANNVNSPYATIWPNFNGAGQSSAGQTKTTADSLITTFNGYCSTTVGEFDNHCILFDSSTIFTDPTGWAQLLGDGTAGTAPAHPNSYGADTLAQNLKTTFMAAGLTAADLLPSARASNALIRHIPQTCWLEPDGFWNRNTALGDTTTQPALQVLMGFLWEAEDDYIIRSAGIEVTTAGAGSTINLAIYDDTDNWAYPAVLLGKGSVSGASTGFQQTPLNNANSLYVPVRRGMKFWVAYLALSGTAPTVRTFLPSRTIPIITANPPAVNIAGVAVKYYGRHATGQASVPSAWPAPSATSIDTNSLTFTAGIPRVYLLVDKC